MVFDSDFLGRLQELKLDVLEKLVPLIIKQLDEGKSTKLCVDDDNFDEQVLHKLFNNPIEFDQLCSKAFEQVRKTLKCAQIALMIMTSKNVSRSLVSEEILTTLVSAYFQIILSLTLHI